MSKRVRAAAKTLIRRASRGIGYEIVPFASGFLEVQRRVLESVGTVVDVGANVGQFAERLRDLGFAGTVVSFEPGSEAFAVLSTRAARDSLWEARQIALGHATGTAELRVSANSVSSSLLDVGQTHLMAAPKSETTHREDVPLSTLDAQFGEGSLESVYLKLDVQGFELEVLKGARNFLRCVIAVQVEVSFVSLYQGQSGWLDICEFLQGEGLVVRYFEPGYEDSDSGFMLQADLLFVRDPSPALRSDSL